MDEEKVKPKVVHIRWVAPEDGDYLVWCDGLARIYARKGTVIRLETTGDGAGIMVDFEAKEKKKRSREINERLHGGDDTCWRCNFDCAVLGTSDRCRKCFEDEQEGLGNTGFMETPPPEEQKS